jgi:hypothetical protein
LIASCAAAIGALSFGLAAYAADDPASTPKASATTGAPKGKDDPDRVICKGQQVTGSAIPKAKVCHTKREWDEISEQSRQMMDSRGQNNPTQH